MIFSAYRRDDFADPDGFVLQLGLVLERYPDAVILEVTSPLTGIQRRHKGRPPDIAAIVEACDDEVARVERIKRLGALKIAPRERETGGNRANVFVPADNERYPELAARAKTADPLDWRRDEERAGIWVVLGWLDEEQPKARAGFKRLTGDELMALYGGKP